MNTVFDYLAWRGDLTVTERPFNDVDNVVLSTVIYFPFDELVSEEGTTMREVWQRATERDLPQNGITKLMEACAQSQRFGDVKVQNYVALTDEKEQIQFAAATFIWADGTTYVAYRGTDDTIVGWREDFNTSFMTQTAAQKRATDYLNDVLKTHPDVLVGGHSKGGNLAVYASAFCDQALRDGVRQVYTNDGPGFNHSVSDTKEFADVLPKTKLIIPECSVISVIMTNAAQKIVAKCKADSMVAQHDPLTWGITRDGIDAANEQAPASLMMNDIINKWLGNLTGEQLEMFVGTVFDALQDSGAKTLTELNDKKWTAYNAVLAAIHAQDGEHRTNLAHTVRKLISAGTEVLWDAAIKKFIPHPDRNKSPVLLPDEGTSADQEETTLSPKD